MLLPVKTVNGEDGGKSYMTVYTPSWPISGTNKNSHGNGIDCFVPAYTAQERRSAKTLWTAFRFFVFSKLCFSELIIKALPYKFTASHWPKDLEFAQKLWEGDLNTYCNNKLNMHNSSVHPTAASKIKNDDCIEHITWLRVAIVRKRSELQCTP